MGGAIEAANLAGLLIRDALAKCDRLGIGSGVWKQMTRHSSFDSGHHRSAV
jgi:hypothetical protein